MASKQQFISKLKVPAHRKAIKGYGAHEPSDTGVSKNDPEILLYAVQASGPLQQAQDSKTKTLKTTRELGDERRLHRLIQVQLYGEQTRYRFFQEDDNASIFDQESMHFMPQIDQPR